ncbi:MAG: adenosine deaminase [Polaromonas sp. 39-63-203]|uniref:DNA-3-methyladenine glycosylase 2 family protein n=1 Tax=Polaromonas sp. TaxID=1869339 RepID=UPI000BCEA2AC|nr:AlkA N-terminal domain-containing protein [Polaromonas sp.]OYY52887.1 MAG: adenosine deaminase [Polaromonas sp. 35-63-240]OYY99364.1 MAG: adenosine deaminase [Polaromonas sp. 28-63-22]OYZ83965.1 MAG: adenosine deaminase [Polaromonas sp. 24-62-144]OZA98591.1 MAG: adenosine deaminase [Polaromonas sp. 39-63-203]HQS33108.1 AlkA N-terminal domain-containing protein [Polaromonas sp.]
MTPEQITAADDACYLALKARDARFDGCFFTGVTSTGIYCRPVCSVKAPKRENCRFFGLAAQAESAGFRPCLRCRPELAPHSVVWSIQDASYILAHQAARLLDEPENWAPTLVASRTSLPPEGALRLRPGGAGSAAPAGEDPASTLVTSSTSLPPEGALRLRPGGAGSVAPAGEERSSGVIAGLASRLGISDRHLRRIFEAQFGVSPVQYLQTRRLLTAKQLLADTALPITQVALISGFASVRRFNAAFVGHYGLNPTQLRRQGAPRVGHGMVVRLGYRPPYDVAAMLGFFGRRAIGGVELIDAEARQPVLRRTLRMDVAGQTRTGWISAQFDVPRSQLLLQVSDTLREVLPQVIRRVRAAFDLDADPKAINSVLHASFPAGDGLRVPGALDGYELAVRAVLGQQITVAAGRTLAQRLVMQFGEAVETPWPQLTRLFPAPAVLAAASGDALGRLGIVRQRQAAITAIARAVQGNTLVLHGGADVHATVEALKALPGIGDWTAQYIAMRALRWPDAFPAGDVALHKALGLQGLKNPAKHAELASQAWKPWRSYAVIRAWSGAFTEPATAALPEPARKPPAVAIDLIAARAGSTWAAA